MTRSLALPSFKTGPKDELAAPDIYNIDTKTTINKIQAFSLEEDVKVEKLSMLQGGKAMLSKAKEGLTVLNAVKAISAKGNTPLDQVLNAQNGLQGVLRVLPANMGTGLGKDLQTYLTGMTAGVKEGAQYIAKINGLQQVFKKGTDIAKIGALGEMINVLSCDKQVFTMQDQRATVGAYSSVIGVAMQNGIPGAFGAVLKCESNMGIMNQVAAACLPAVTLSSDLKSLTDMANRLKPGTITGFNPTILTDFTNKFALPAGAKTTTSLTGQFTELKDTFSKITPDWLATPFGGGSVTNLSCVMGASKDFGIMANTSILSNPNRTEQDIMMLASIGEKPKDVATELKEQFPFMALPEPGVAPVSYTIQGAIDAGNEVRNNLSTSSIGNLLSISSSAPPVTIAVTNKVKWTAQDEEALKRINKRYGYDVVERARYVKSWAMNEWMGGKLNDDEVDLINRAVQVK